MKSRIIKSLYKKEILEVLRDKKTVIMMLVVPLLLYPLLMVATLKVATSVSSSMQENTYKVALSETAMSEELCELFSKQKEKSFELVSPEDWEEKLSDSDIDVYIDCKTDEAKQCYTVHYISSVNNSSYAAALADEVLKEYKQQLTMQKLEEAGLDADIVLEPVIVGDYDHASSEESAGSLVGSVVPFMLIISLMMGTMYPAIDTTAGERERGTLETVLTLPVTNRELIFSKFLTVATVGIVSAILNVISMGGVTVYMYKLVSSVTGVQTLRLGRFIPPIIICILCIFAFAIFMSAASMCVCAFAKSYKEANNYITPLTLVVMLASFVGFIPNVELTPKLALAPVANICLLLKELFAFKYNLTTIMLVLVSNVIYGILTVMLLARVYNSESVLFGDGTGGLQIFEKRKNIKKGGAPSLGDMVLVIAVVLFAIIYIGGSVQAKNVKIGVLVTQLLILFIPLLAALYTKSDIRKTFSLRRTSTGYYFAALLYILGGVCVGMVLSTIVITVFHLNVSNEDAGLKMLIGDNFPVMVLLIAILPAICEEMMFRGYIFSALRTGVKPVKAIIISAIIFGAYHMSAAKFLTTAVLGGLICCMTYRSGSILPGMLMHLLNNFLSCFATFYPEKVERICPVLLEPKLDRIQLLSVTCLGICLIVLGHMIMNKIERKLSCET